MSLSLGIDTGGTYTDAVILDAQTETVIAKAKALTTRHDLAVGIAEAAGRALADAAVDAATIGLVSISTTLATNALVEGHGGRVALVMIGFGEKDLDKSGLRAALGDDPVVFVPGGHDTHGRAAPLDLAPLEALVDRAHGGVSAFAVAGYFAVRNPEHECAARDLIRARTGLPVTCSHELTSKLDGPRRALTTLLNARLIGLIDGLIAATRRFLAERDVDAPLMVVRGDGSLVSADFAALRPIETILSGPAASLVGARFLTGRDDAHVADIGGTTTDIALLDQGRPRIDPDGAQVGGHATMVEAVAVRTFGLGGDSEVSHEQGALDPEIHLGPRRVVPLSLAEMLFPGQIVPHLKRQMERPLPSRLDGRFALRSGVPDRFAGGLTRSQADLLARITASPEPLAALTRSTAELATLSRLAARGLVLLCGFTPSDAQHVLGRFEHWNREAARIGAGIIARQRDGYGRPMADTPEAMARRVVARLERLSAERVLESAFAGDGLTAAGLAQTPIVRRALDRQGGLVRAALILDRPVIGLGAGAGAYYPAVGALLGTETVIPDHADVANAIGAVAGQVRITATAEVAPSDTGESFVVTGVLSARYDDEASALAAARRACHDLADDRARQAGAATVSITLAERIDAPVVDELRRFVGATVTATAVGRPATR
ncbi:MAG: hydantoinase/oxoprolinase family protein [Roseitalea porphyridii]|uniref:hydantoinase/oxoprolinase family protein n=1 Tax=Roseitalea porphyridii TaxID=1852022 RepID=UPI0032D98747